MNTLANDKQVRSEILWHEQQALHRLKRLAAEPPPPLNRRWLWLAALRGFFAPVDLVRQVGPGQRPLERHEWPEQNRDPRNQPWVI